jgi:hypothetical protein
MPSMLPLLLLLAAFICLARGIDLARDTPSTSDCTPLYTAAYMSTLNGECAQTACTPSCQAKINAVRSACADQKYTETDPITGIVVDRSFLQKSMRALQLMGPVDCDYQFGVNTFDHYYDAPEAGADEPIRGHPHSGGSESVCVDTGFMCHGETEGSTDYCQGWASDSACQRGSCVQPASCVEAGTDLARDTASTSRAIRSVTYIPGTGYYARLTLSDSYITTFDGNYQYGGFANGKPHWKSESGMYLYWGPRQKWLLRSRFTPDNPTASAFCDEEDLFMGDNNFQWATTDRYRHLIGAWVPSVLHVDRGPPDAGAGATCWEAYTPAYSCRGYTSVGYTCVGNFCAAMDPGGTPLACAEAAPPGSTVDPTTGRCSKDGLYAPIPLSRRERGQAFGVSVTSSRQVDVATRIDPGSIRDRSGWDDVVSDGVATPLFRVDRTPYTMYGQDVAAAAGGRATVGSGEKETSFYVWLVAGTPAMDYGTPTVTAYPRGIWYVHKRSSTAVAYSGVCLGTFLLTRLLVA